MSDLDTAPGAERPGEADADVGFTAPWELRAFALAVAAHRAGHYEWPRFQTRLVDAVQGWESAHTAPGADRDWHYYERWLEAFEVVATGLGVDPAELDARTETVLATPRDAEHQRARREPVAVSPRRSGSRLSPTISDSQGEGRIDVVEWRSPSHRTERSSP